MTSTLRVAVKISDGTYKAHGDVSEQKQPLRNGITGFTKPLEKPCVFLGSLKLFGFLAMNVYSAMCQDSPLLHPVIEY